MAKERKARGMKGPPIENRDADQTLKATISEAGSEQRIKAMFYEGPASGFPSALERFGF